MRCWVPWLLVCCLCADSFRPSRCPTLTAHSSFLNCRWTVFQPIIAWKDEGNSRTGLTVSPLSTGVTRKHRWRWIYESWQRGPEPEFGKKKADGHKFPFMAWFFRDGSHSRGPSLCRPPESRHRLDRRRWGDEVSCGQSRQLSEACQQLSPGSRTSPPPEFYRFLVLHNQITHPGIRTTAQQKLSAAPSLPPGGHFFLILFTLTPLLLVYLSERGDSSNHNFLKRHQQSNQYLCWEMTNLCIKHESSLCLVLQCKKKKTLKRSRKYEMVVLSSSRENLEVQNFTAAC